MKKAVITGATKGIGRAVTEKLISENFDVAICARSMDDLMQFKSELNERFPDRHVFVRTCDVSKRSELETFIHDVKGHWNELDILVNNAGVFIPGFVIKEEDGTLEKLIETNLYSAYYLSRGVLNMLQKGQKSHIFNICSIASLLAYPNGGSYTISKFAMLGLSKALREELKEDGIRVSSVMPGAVKTASWEGVDLPDERFIMSEDIAELIWTSYNLSASACVEDIVIRPTPGDI